MPCRFVVGEAGAGGGGEERCAGAVRGKGERRGAVNGKGVVHTVNAIVEAGVIPCRFILEAGVNEA